MIRIKEFDIKPIKNLEYEKIWDGCKELLPVATDGDINDWGRILKQHHETMRAGIGKYRIFALEVEINLESDEVEKDLCKIFSDYFVRRFTETNILSIKEFKSENEYTFRLLIYPQKFRAMAPEEWFLTTDGEFFTYSNEMLVQIYDVFSSAFQSDVSFGENLHFSSGKVSSLAKTDLIKDMNLGENSYSYKARIYDASGNAEQINHGMPNRDYKRLVGNAIEYFTTGAGKSSYLQLQTGNIKSEEYLEEMEKYLKRMRPEITKEDVDSIRQEFIRAVFGYYVIEPLIEDENVSDIKVLAYDEIRVKCSGQRMTSNMNFLNIKDMERFFDALAIRYKLNYHNKAIHVLTDKRTSNKFILRINITTPEINSNGMFCLHIRKIRKNKMTSEELIRQNVCPRHIYEYLRWKINTSSIMLIGKGGSGKSTVLNTLIEDIDYGRSALILQETEELHSELHPDFMFQHIVPDENGIKGYSLQDESRNGLLTDLDYFIIGEIKGGEALYFLNACATGHKCACTIHGASSRAGMDKMADYVMYESKYNKEQAMFMLKEMKVLVFMEDFKIKEITEIEGYDETTQQMKYKTIYEL